MSQFTVIVEPVTLEPHPNADRLSIAHVRGWQCIVATENWVGRDRGAYVPIEAVIPEDKQIEWGLVGRLGGSKKNRVKTIKLRGVLSQGLLIAVDNDVPLGTDLTEAWGITKYEPPAPVMFGGGGAQLDTKPWPVGLRHYDIERIENYPDVLQEGEAVAATEKLEGTNVSFDLRLTDNNVWDFTVCGRNVAFDVDGERNQKLIYVQMAKAVHAEEILRRAASYVLNWSEHVPTYVRRITKDGFHSVTLRGEIIGAGVQGNIYKLSTQQVRFFDIDINDRSLGYREFEESLTWMRELGLQDAWQDNHLLLLPVPTLYIGPFSTNFRALSYGPSAYNAKQLREGAIWRPLQERFERSLGRVILKAVDPEYLSNQKD